MKKFLAAPAALVLVALALSGCASGSDAPNGTVTLDDFSEEFSVLDTSALEEMGGLTVTHDDGEWLLLSAPDDRGIGDWYQGIIMSMPSEDGTSELRTAGQTIYFDYDTVVDGEQWSLLVSREPLG